MVQLLGTSLTLNVTILMTHCLQTLVEQVVDGDSHGMILQYLR